MKAGDLEAFTAEVTDYGATIVDMPTALWQYLWCDDVDAIAGWPVLGRDRLRSVVSSPSGGHRQMGQCRRHR